MKITNPMVGVKISKKSKPSNGVNIAGGSSESLLPGRCLLVRRMDTVVIELLLIGIQRGNWSQEENRIAMQCYYRSKYGRNKYRLNTINAINTECMPYEMKFHVSRHSRPELVK